jgi:hypothetical protein
VPEEKRPGETGGVGSFVASRSLVWPRDRPLFCSARSRSAIDLGASVPSGADLFRVSKNPDDQKLRTHVA